MLSDQSFDEVPIIALGPEVFKDPDGFHGLDLPTVIKFRSKFCRFKQWQFIYIGLKEDRDLIFLELLRNMGVKLTGVFRAEPDKLEDVTHWAQLQPLLEWVYSPALVARMSCRNDIALDGNKYVLLNCLEHYYMSIEPYSKANFRELYQRLWTAN